MKSWVLGVLVGAIASVLWFELWLILVPVAGGVTLAWLVGSRSRPLWIAAAQALVAALTVMALAHAAPFKFVDRRIDQPLSSAQLSLRLLAVELRAHGRVQAVMPELPDVIVQLPSAQPTYRQLDEALRDAGFTIDLGYCGNGATLLWGAHPLHLSLEPLAEEK